MSFGPRQFSLKSLMIFITAAAAALTASKYAASLNDGGEINPNLIAAVLAGSAALWGTALGAMMDRAWRGAVIGLLSAIAALAGFIAFDGR